MLSRKPRSILLTEKGPPASKSELTIFTLRLMNLKRPLILPQTHAPTPPLSFPNSQNAGFDLESPITSGHSGVRVSLPTRTISQRCVFITTANSNERCCPLQLEPSEGPRRGLETENTSHPNPLGSAYLGILNPPRESYSEG